ncbi:hypothetical protein [Aurantimonas sp. VKM B-3413]|nr:hypothetical protein [Aurantimonas sp. VKM B-3413]
MLVFALSMAMVLMLATATAITLHSEAQDARVKVLAKKSRRFY